MYLIKEDVYQYACIFAQHIVIAIDCMDQSHAMNRIFCDSRFSSKYKIAPHFFRTTYHALRFRFEIEVYKLFGDEANSFDSFKNILVQNNMIRSDNAKKYKDLRKAADKDIKEIRMRRNKIHAHSDAEMFNNPDIFLEEHPFCWGNIRKLLICALDICNWVVLTHTKDGISDLYGIRDSDDFVRLFDCETEFDKYRDEILKDWRGKL